MEKQDLDAPSVKGKCPKWVGICNKCGKLWELNFQHAILAVLCPKEDCDGVIPLYPKIEGPDE